MKRVKGFTLAEILITLGIIGVVAALTAPALIQNAGNAKIGPTLAKVKTTIENANEMMLLDNTASNLYAVANNTPAYMEMLSEYISGSSYNSTAGGGVYNSYYYGGSNFGGIGSCYNFNFSDTVTMWLGTRTDSDTIAPLTHYSANGSFKGLYLTMAVDINGLTGPNTLGKDLFIFAVDYGGSVIPAGSRTHKWLSGDSYYWDPTTSDQYGYGCNEDGVNYGFGCAGSIFDNNLKVIYQ